MRKITVILSGGLDSTVLLYKAVKEVGVENVNAITFNYGQRHSKEIEFAKRTAHKLGVQHEVLKMAAIGKQIFKSALTDKDAKIPEGHYADDNLQTTVVPNRNMIMISLTAAFAISHGTNEIWYGAHAGDHSNYPDCRPEFIEALKGVLALCHFEPITLQAPFEHMSKAEIVATGLALKVPFEDTWSCYDGKEEACGKCGTCVDRLKAFHENGAKDPAVYSYLPAAYIKNGTLKRK